MQRMYQLGRLHPSLERRGRQTLVMGILSGSKKKLPAKYLQLVWRGGLQTVLASNWREPEFRNTYDVIIIGGGVRWAGNAYYLYANHGITNVAVVDKQYLGGSGRNTVIVRSNYLTPEGLFYDRASSSTTRCRATQPQRDVQ